MLTAIFSSVTSARTPRGDDGYRGNFGSESEALRSDNTIFLERNGDNPET